MFRPPQIDVTKVARGAVQSLGYSADPSPDIDPVRWMEDNFYVYDIGAKLKIYECQERPLREALSRDETGLYRYDTVLWSWPKKSAKSTIVAAVVHFVASNYPRSMIRLVANDQRQADSRVGKYLRESIKLHPIDKKHIHIAGNGLTINYPNGSLVEMVPIDPAGEAGGNDRLIVYSELWGWKSAAHQRMWSEMTLSPNKFGQSQRWIDTYAGYKGDSPVLFSLYDKLVTEENLLWSDHEAYAHGRMFGTWVTKPMLPWQQGENGRAYYKSEEENLARNEYSRMHENQWVGSTEAFVSAEWWDACAEDYGDGPAYPNQEVVLSADAGVSSDCFAIVAVTREDGITREVFNQVWYPPKGGKIVFSDIHNPMNEETPEGVIRRKCDQWNVIKLTYDPYQLHDLVTRLRQDAVVDANPFDQGPRRAIADKLFHDSIRNRTFRHRGKRRAADLRTHVLNADKETNNEKLRIVKAASLDKIDLAVATSMGNHEAVRLNL